MTIVNHLIKSLNRWELWLTVLLLMVIALGLILDTLYVALLPFGLGLLWWMCLDLKRVLWLIFATIPVSVEVYLPIGLGLDIPDEPLMMLCTGLLVFWMIQKGASLDFRIFFHPLLLFLTLQILWASWATLFAVDKTIALKFVVAKMWYIGPFFLAIYYWCNDLKCIESLLKVFFALLIMVVAWIVFRHGYEFQFSFAEVNKALYPLFRNHVSYAALLAVSFPYLFFYILKQRSLSKPFIHLVFFALLLLLAINFSYTRAAIGAVFMAVPYYFIIRFRLTKIALITTVILASVIIWRLTDDYRYMNMAPRYEKTITHTRFEDLLDATYKFQDISTMERVYRWVAAFHMVRENPLTGVGPNNFYENYQKYTVTAFRTYVSHNPEKSGVHNYYLMLITEQGIPGLAIYLIFTFWVLIWGENLFQKVRRDSHKSWYVLAALCSLVIIHLLQLMNDLLETDKVGPFYFLSLAILAIVHMNVLKEANLNVKRD